MARHPGNSLYPLYILNWAHPCDGRDLLRVGFDATLGDDKTQQHTPWDPKNALLKVEFDTICLEFCKGLLKIGNEVVSPFGLNYDVINVGLNGPPDEVPEASEHTSLVRCRSVLQTKRHRDIAVRSEGGDERCRELVGLFHRDLMIAGIRIKEAESFAP